MTTPVVLADRFSGPGLYLHQHVERRVCRECRAPVREQRYYGFKSPVTILACERDERHAGHFAVIAGGKPAGTAA